MKNTLTYKNYIGSVEFSEDDGLFFGQLLGIKALVSYEGTNASELIADFHSAVDDYLRYCEENNKSPELPYKGSTNIRLKPETHRSAAIYAINHYTTLNSLIENAVTYYLQTHS